MQGRGSMQHGSHRQTHAIPGLTPYSELALTSVKRWSWLVVGDAGSHGGGRGAAGFRSNTAAVVQFQDSASVG